MNGKYIFSLFLIVGICSWAANGCVQDCLCSILAKKYALKCGGAQYRSGLGNLVCGGLGGGYGPASYSLPIPISFGAYPPPPPPPPPPTPSASLVCHPSFHYGHRPAPYAMPYHYSDDVDYVPSSYCKCPKRRNRYNYL